MHTDTIKYVQEKPLYFQFLATRYEIKYNDSIY